MQVVVVKFEEENELGMPAAGGKGGEVKLRLKGGDERWSEFRG